MTRFGVWGGCILVAIILFPIAARANSGLEESTATFLLIPAGARAAGMGGAFVGLADDANATWWNPAGLAFLERPQLTSMLGDWFPSLHLPSMWDGYGSYVKPMGDAGTIGGHIQVFNLTTVDRRCWLHPYLGDINLLKMAYNLSYGAKLNENTGLGVNVKYVYSNLVQEGGGQVTGSGADTDIAVDIGVLHKTVDPVWGRPLSVGANLSNVGPQMSSQDIIFSGQSFTYVARTEPIPTNLAFGFASTLLDGSKYKLTLVGQVDKLLVRKYPDGTADPLFIALFTSWTDVPFFYDMTYHVGAEYWYREIVGVRAGYWNDEFGKNKPVTVGGSVNLKALHIVPLRFDISYWKADEKNPLDGTTEVSLTLNF